MEVDGGAVRCGRADRLVQMYEHPTGCPILVNGVPCALTSRLFETLLEVVRWVDNRLRDPGILDKEKHVRQKFIIERGNPAGARSLEEWRLVEHLLRSRLRLEPRLGASVCACCAQCCERTCLSHSVLPFSPPRLDPRNGACRFVVIGLRQYLDALHGAPAPAVDEALAIDAEGRRDAKRLEQALLSCRAEEQRKKERELAEQRARERDRQQQQANPGGRYACKRASMPPEASEGPDIAQNEWLGTCALAAAPVMAAEALYRVRRQQHQPPKTHILRQSASSLGWVQEKRFYHPHTLQRYRACELEYDSDDGADTEFVRQRSAAEMRRLGVPDGFSRFYRAWNEFADKLDKTSLHAMQMESRGYYDKHVSLLERAFEVVVICNLQGHIVFWNRAASELYGWCSEEVLGKELCVVLRTRMSRPRSEIVLEVMDKGFWEGDAVHTSKEGFSVLVSCRWCFDISLSAGPVIICFECSQMDGTRRLLDMMNEGIIVRTLDDTITYWSHGAEEMYGWRAPEVQGAKTNDLLRTKFPAPLSSIIESVRKNGFWSGELTQTKKTGETVRVHSRWIIEPLNKHAMSIVEINRNISEHARASEAKEKLENQLRQAQKMEAVGRLAGGLAHDFNNVLTDAPEGSKSLSALESVMSAAMHASGLIRQLLDFSRQQPERQVRFSVTDAISSMDWMLRSVLGEKVTVVLDLTGGKVLLNLAINSRDAMPDGGVFNVRTERIERPPPSLWQGREHMPSPSVVVSLPEAVVLIEVSDTGAGMPQDVRERCFEPLFTTKGSGTGLGLSSVYAVVKQHGGTVFVESEEMKGTVFHIVLPIAGAGSEAPSAKQTHELRRGSIAMAAHREVIASSPSPSPQLGGAPVSVLYVEEDPMVRKLTEQVLRRSGFRVTVAFTFDAAAAVCLSGAAFDLVVASIPRYAAEELRGKCSGRGTEHPHLLVVVEAETAAPSEAVWPEGTFHVAKPYTPQDLLRVVSSCLYSKDRRELLHRME
eukprot:m51a1_g2960 putative Fixl like pas pac sensor hybrid histidine kinase (995) ;mRNA; f:669354-673125